MGYKKYIGIGLVCLYLFGSNIIMIYLFGSNIIMIVAFGRIGYQLRNIEQENTLCDEIFFKNITNTVYKKSIMPAKEKNGKIINLYRDILWWKTEQTIIISEKVFRFTAAC